MAMDGQAACPRNAEIALAQVRPLPNPPLERPPPTRQTARKGRLNFLYLGLHYLLLEVELAKHGALDQAHYRPAPRGPPAVVMAA